MHERVKTSLYAAAFVALEPLQVAHLISFVCDEAGHCVRILWVLAEGVRFDGHGDHLVLHVVLPEGRALGHLLEHLTSLISRQDLVKADRFHSRFG